MSLRMIVFSSLVAGIASGQPAQALEQCNDNSLLPDEFVIADTLYNFCLAEKTRSPLFNFLVNEANQVTGSSRDSIELIENMADKIPCRRVLGLCK